MQVVKHVPRIKGDRAGCVTENNTGEGEQNASQAINVNNGKQAADLQQYSSHILKEVLFAKKHWVLLGNSLNSLQSLGCR